MSPAYVWSFVLALSPFLLVVVVQAVTVWPMAVIFSLGLFASRKYLDRCGTPRSVPDLAGHDFVTYLDDLIQVDAVRWLDEIIAEPRRSFRSSSMLAQMAAAEAGRGIVLLPLFAVVDKPGLVRLLPDCSVRRELWLSADQDIATLPRVSLAMRALRDLLLTHRL